MSGYSGTPLLRKLGVRDEHVVLLDRAPDGFELGDTAARVVRRLPGRGALVDVTLTFHTHRSTLEPRLPALFERTTSSGSVWICWPKLAARKALGIAADLSEGAVREVGLGLGWVDVKVAAIDETWSGLKFVRRRAGR